MAYNVFREEFVPEETGAGIKRRKPKVVYSRKHQTGKSIKYIDEKRTALPPGKRISKTGKVYWESRKSRSDLVGEMI